MVLAKLSQSQRSRAAQKWSQLLEADEMKCLIAGPSSCGSPCGDLCRERQVRILNIELGFRVKRIVMHYLVERLHPAANQGRCMIVSAQTPFLKYRFRF